MGACQCATRPHSPCLLVNCPRCQWRPLSRWQCAQPPDPRPATATPPPAPSASPPFSITCTSGTVATRRFLAAPAATPRRRRGSHAEAGDVRQPAVAAASAAGLDGRRAGAEANDARFLGSRHFPRGVQRVWVEEMPRWYCGTGTRRATLGPRKRGIPVRHWEDVQTPNAKGEGSPDRDSSAVSATEGRTPRPVSMGT